MFPCPMIVNLQKVVMLVHLMSHNESELNANEKQRPNSSVQLFDPLLRRRISGWSIKSQIFEPQNQF